MEGALPAPPLSESPWGKSKIGVKVLSANQFVHQHYTGKLLSAAAAQRGAKAFSVSRFSFGVLVGSGILSCLLVAAAWLMPFLTL